MNSCGMFRGNYIGQRESLWHGVDLVLKAPPYNVRPVKVDKNAEHDKFLADVLKNLVLFVVF